MPFMHRNSRRGLIATLILATSLWIGAVQTASAQQDEPTGDDMVDRIVFREESTDQVLALLEQLTGRAVIRPQALPAATFTFNSQRPMTRDEAILAITSLLSINGIGVNPMGDLFLRVIPLNRVRSESPEFLTEPASNLPPSGRVVSRLLELEFLRIAEVQTQLNLLLNPNGGSIIPFEKANSLLVTDTVSNIQAMEELLEKVDRPFSARADVNFYPVRHARAPDLVNQIQAIATGPAGVELGSGTMITADERTNQIILAADRRQVEYFERLIERLDVPADLHTGNEVLYLKHANAVEVAGLLSNLAGGRSGGAAAGSGSSARGSRGQQRSRTGIGTRGGQQQQRQQQQRQRQQPGLTVPLPTGRGGRVGAQQATEAVQEIMQEAAGSGFSEELTILPDERSNAIIVSGTREDVALIRDLIEKIDIILAQVRIEVFIAEVTLTNSYGRGITEFGIGYIDGTLSPTLRGPGYSLSVERTSGETVNWEALFTAAETNSNIKVLSVPTIVTTHNQEATIEVGESRPIITGTLSDGSFQRGSIRTDVSYQNIGIILNVTPLIGSDGTIQLEIDQEVNDIVDEVTIDGNDQPVIGTRRATSFVSVADRETVILGGLQSTNRNQTGSRLGLLGQIPVLGNLFTSRSKSDIRRELLVFIRPTVLHSTEDAHRDAQQAIEKHSQRDSIREVLNPPPPPPPPGHSPAALELRERSREAQE